MGSEATGRSTSTDEPAFETSARDGTADAAKLTKSSAASVEAAGIEHELSVRPPIDARCAARFRETLPSDSARLAPLG